MVQRRHVSIADTLDITFRVYRRNIALFVRGVVTVLLPFLLFWMLFALRDGNVIDWLHFAPIRPDVFVQLLGELGTSDSPLDQVRAYGTSIVFFFVLHLFITNTMVQTAAQLLLGADAVVPPPRFGIDAPLLLLPAVLLLLPVHLFGTLIAEQVTATPPFIAALLQGTLMLDVVPPLLATVLPPLLAGGLLLGLAARLLLAPPIVLVENGGPFGCMRRSWQLTRGHGLRVWATLALLEALIGMLASLPLVAASLAVLLSTGPALLPALFTGAAIVSQALYVALLPLPFIAMTVLYKAVTHEAATE